MFIGSHRQLGFLVFSMMLEFREAFLLMRGVTKTREIGLPDAVSIRIGDNKQNIMAWKRNCQASWTRPSPAKAIGEWYSESVTNDRPATPYGSPTEFSHCSDLPWLCERVWVHCFPNRNYIRCRASGCTHIRPVLCDGSPRAGGVGVHLRPSGCDCPSRTVEIARSK